MPALVRTSDSSKGGASWGSATTTAFVGSAGFSTGLARTKVTGSDVATSPARSVAVATREKVSPSAAGSGKTAAKVSDVVELVAAMAMERVRGTPVAAGVRV